MWMQIGNICRAAAVLLLVGTGWFFWRMRLDRIIKENVGRMRRRRGKAGLLRIFLWLAAGWIGFSVYAEAAEQRDGATPEQTERILLEAVDGANREGGIFYYNRGVDGKVTLEKHWLETGRVGLYAVPLDAVAETSAAAAGRKGQKGNGSGGRKKPTLLEIENQVCPEENVIEFRFQEEGKWQILCRVLTEPDSADGEAGEAEEKKQPEKAGEAEEEKMPEKAGEAEEEKLFEEESEVFVIDGTAPKLEVRYGNCRSISSAPSSVENVNRQIRRGLREILALECEVTAECEGQVEFRIREEYFMPEDVKIRVLEETYTDGRIRDVTEDMQKEEGWDTEWKKEGDVHVLRLCWEREGHFRFEAACEDVAGNLAEAEDDRETEVCMETGVYRGPMYTVDAAAPVFGGFGYEKEPVRIQGSRAYFRKEPVLVVEVEEENFNRTDYSMRDVVTWADGGLMRPAANADAYEMVWTSRYEEGKRINRAYIRVGQEGNHTFSGQVVDASGQSSAVQTGECTYDTTKPEIRFSVRGADVVRPYRSYQYFGREALALLVTVSDRISGVRSVSVSQEHEQDGRWKSIGTEKMWNEKTDVRQEDLSEYCREIEWKGEACKGRFRLQAEDYTGNTAVPAVSPGMVLESPQTHERIGNVRWEISEADYADETRGILYYRKPFTLTAVAEDTCSGIGEMQMQAKTRQSGGGSGKEKVHLTKRTNRGGEADITYEEKIAMEIRPGTMEETSPRNPVRAEVLMTDNAGNRTEKRYKAYTIVADARKPEIQVTYDVRNKDGGAYYNCARTATVTVRDQNFDPESVRWKITGSNRRYQISPWTVEEDLYRCQIRFARDGENYRVRLSVKDYAGNRSVWDKDTAFTIDRTPPEVRVEMQVEEAKNGKYYKDPQTVTLTVKDRNMDVREGLVCFVNGTGNRCTLTRTRDSRFAAAGVFQGKKLFRKDGVYRVRYRCVDLAGNVTVSEAPVRFVIDGTAPQIRVAGVADGAAYGGAIRPETVVTDRNLETDAVSVRIRREDGGTFAVGENVPVQVTDGRSTAVEGKGLVQVWERRWLWEDFPRTEAADGVYRLQVYARDKAGNQASLGEGITFTVNRFGAVYYYKKALEDTIAAGYMKEEAGIVITEASVNALDSRIIILKDNQSRRELYAPGEGYTVADGRISTEEEGRKGWYVRRHYISAENFQEEGTYQITVQSGSYVEKDGRREWIRETSNELKGMPIRFTVDRTPPAVVISGLDDVLYGEGKRPFVVTAMDNYEFAGLELRIRYEGRGNREEILRITEKDLGEDHSVEKELQAYEGKQILSYRVWDQAGNYLDTSEEGREITCVMTEEPAVRVRYENPWIFRIAMAAAGSAILAVILCIHAAWSKKNAEDA